MWFTQRFDAQGDAEGATAEASSPGGGVGFEVTEFEENKRLGYRQWAASPETGIDVTVTFEEVLGGTRITMTQAGFGGDSILATDQVRNGMDETLADLALYLNHGVHFARHRDLSADCELGADLHQIVAGVEIGEVTDGEFCDDAGLRSGDVLLQLGDVPVFRVSDVMFFLRSHAQGESVSATWARDGEVHRGSGRLGARDELVFCPSRLNRSRAGC